MLMTEAAIQITWLPHLCEYFQNTSSIRIKRINNNNNNKYLDITFQPDIKQQREGASGRSINE